MNDERTHDLHRLFYPKTVAFVGASPNVAGPMWGANGFIDGYVKLNFQGKIFPVHPKADSIMGFKSYKRIQDIPDELDLVIFAVPYKAVLPVMQDCAEKGVKFAHIFTAGFSETGRAENTALEQELLRIAREGGVRIVGPNCMGLYCPEGGITWSNEFPSTPGQVGFVSQSGQLAGHFVGEGQLAGLRYSKVVSFGNASDLKAHEFFNYLAEDEKTTIIGSYLEGLKDGREFFEFAKSVTRKKPLVVWKGGQTEGGGRATMSHTGSIAGSPKIWKALCRQAGVISVNSMEELVGTISALQRVPLPTGTRVAVLGGAGGGSVTMTDAAEHAGLQVPHLSEKTINTLEKFVPISGSSVKNPLDIMGALFGMDESMNMIRLFELLRDDPHIDALVYSQMVEMFSRRGGRMFLDMIMNMTVKGAKKLEKPMFLVLGRGQSLEGESFRQEALQKYNAAGVATFDSFDIAARVVANLSQYQKFLSDSNR
jgi:acyl-CoA synthetase (NDP forming)